MVTINDIYSLAKRVEDSLREFDKTEIGGFQRDDIAISLRLPKVNVLALDEELHYALGRLPHSGYEPTDSIAVKVWGIPIEITSKEDDLGTEPLDNGV